MSLSLFTLIIFSFVLFFCSFLFYCQFFSFFACTLSVLSLLLCFIYLVLFYLFFMKDICFCVISHPLFCFLSRTYSRLLRSLHKFRCMADSLRSLCVCTQALRQLSEAQMISSIPPCISCFSLMSLSFLSILSFVSRGPACIPFVSFRICYSLGVISVYHSPEIISENVE